MTQTAVQTAFYDAPGALFPGQLADAASAMLNGRVRSFRAESLLNFGRWVVKGTLNAQTDPIQTPYGIKAPIGSNVLGDFVGIACRPHASITDVNGNGQTVRATQMVPMAEPASAGQTGIIVGAEVPAGITIADGDPVYISVSHATIPVGACSNAAATGLVGPHATAKWYGAAAAGSVGRIQL